MINNGIDIVYIPRFAKIKNNLTIIKKLFTDAEIAYFTNKDIDTIAGIYASKEAALKALELGINDISLKDIEVLHKDNGAPYLNLHNEAKEKAKDFNLSLSISHDHDYAIAIVTLYK